MYGMHCDIEYYLQNVNKKRALGHYITRQTTIYVFPGSWSNDGASVITLVGSKLWNIKYLDLFKNIYY